MTFLELLLVLTIVGVLTALVVPVSSGWTTVQSERDGLEAFKATIQHMQAYSMAHQTTTWLSFTNEGKSYSVTYSDSNEKIKTDFPPSIKFDNTSTLKNISFMENGNMYKTGTMNFETFSGSKKIKFQFQRGRMLIYE
ncbi:type II secretion system protein [Sporosarcina gallistercoris]|uniref:hypothetical protein n=1 Tax=Sporosarcina gallistercoris TaxID=2762245 RepID=UPI003D2CEFD1